MNAFDWVIVALATVAMVGWGVLWLLARSMKDGD